LSNIATIANSTLRHDMTKMPDFNPFPYGTTVINYSGWMCIILRFHEYLLFEGANINNLNGLRQMNRKLLRKV
jgi:hypothetical protein